MIIACVNSFILNLILHKYFTIYLPSYEVLLKETKRYDNIKLILLVKI